MSTGNFPISDRDPHGYLIVRAIQNLESVHRQFSEWAQSLDVPEDAQHDGACLARIQIAIDCLRPCIRVEQATAAGIDMGQGL